MARVTLRPGSDLIVGAMRSMSKKLMQLERANQKVAIFLDRFVASVFKTEGAPYGGWAPFQAGGRRVRGGGFDFNAKLLQDTGELRASYHSFYDRYEAGIGSDLDRAEFHEFGTETIPARQIAPDEADVIDEVMQIYEKHARSVVGRRLW